MSGWLVKFWTGKSDGWTNLKEEEMDFRKSELGRQNWTSETCLVRTGASTSVWNQLRNDSCMGQLNRNIQGHNKLQIWFYLQLPSLSLFIKREPKQIHSHWLGTLLPMLRFCMTFSLHPTFLPLFPVTFTPRHQTPLPESLNLAYHHIKGNIYV